MMRKLLILAMAALVVGLAVLARDQAQAGGGLEISILSSSPDQVSGGDALVRVDVPSDVALGQVTVKLNGVDVTAAFAPAPDDHALVGLVDGFVLGESTLKAKVTGPATPRPAAELTVTNHPVSGPIFSGPQQQPFVCTTARSGLGQPLIDNQDGIGIRVAEEDAFGNYPQTSRGYPTGDAVIIGYSKDCSADTLIVYRYRTTTGAWQPLEDPSAEPLPVDIATTTTMDGDTVPYIVRWERGTINRFIYSVAMLAPTSETAPSDPDQSLWNGKLVFSLEGGVAIGHTQGRTSESAQLRDASLSLGYAVVHSTGLRTNTHYNLQLGGETALMLKEHFIESHGVPEYTVGVGGSGGAIQQYVYGQNHPGLLDAAIPQRSYSDMVTQTIHVGDCELLERYFDVTDGDNPKWLDVENRQAIQGLNASWAPQNFSSNDLAQWNGLYFLYGLLGLPVAERAPGSPAPALTECRAAWFGLTPLVLNPTFTNVDDIDKLAQGTAGVEWTHWGDAVNIYGTDESGFARVPWDNVGVQYGLQALLDGVITPEEFLDLNANVGSWKQTKDMVPEGFPFVGGFSPATFDPWSSRNMNLSPDGGITPAPRRAGDILAMNAAYSSGKVFDGKIDIPIIDWRHYLEDELDMHHSHQSFATRQRMIEGQGNADNQVIWFTDARPSVAFDQTPEAFEVIDQWMANIKANPDMSVAENKPADAVDRCFNTDGSEFASGDDVWDGILNDEPAGACTGKFQIYSSSRIVSGGPLKGGIFKCQTQSVAQAIKGGTYGSWQPSNAERARLNAIFPTGVCDYSRPDVGRPVD